MSIKITTLKDDQELTEHMKEEIMKQRIFWSDDRMCHWFFDFKCDGFWISSWSINNELTEVCVDIFNPKMVYSDLRHGLACKRKEP